ncbi:MAG TPA: MBL fold metallo-hydrolase [Dehalococcoidia bacterium]|nr:MBL fold metallo-hydrolase [Dehalococcoidia bacterium]
MSITIDWLGVATFRLRINDLVLFLDAYMDRVPGASPVGLSAREVDRADFVLVGHSHFDHVAGAEAIARNTGAPIIGSLETCRLMREQSVPDEQLLPSQGGERYRLSPDVTVRVFPSLHACTWCAASIAFDEPLSGFRGLTEDERAHAGGGLGTAIRGAFREDSDESRALRHHLATAVGSLHTGGPLVYLIETPEATIFYQDTTGGWTGVLGDLRADIAILAASSRPNADGEPFEGTLAQFIAQEAAMLQARKVVVSHHDDWMPPVTKPMPDIAPLRAELGRQAPAAALVEMGYLEGVRLA